MASSPDIRDELPWLALSPRKTLKRRLFRHARSALLLGALATPVLIGLIDRSSDAQSSGEAPSNGATPAMIDAPFAPQALRPLSALEAEKWNRLVPETASGVAPAAPFAVGTGDAQSLARSLQCMTAAIYYEAGNEPIDGQRGVAQVILNRMRSPVYPHSVCGVVYQGSERKTGCQFTFTCDGSLRRVPSPTGWARASAVAAAALSGYVHAPVGWATNYHADYVVPYWAQSLAKVATIGRHIFYSWKGGSGTGAGFTSRYAGVEPDVAPGAATIMAQVAPALDPAGGITRVTSAERPVIAFGAQEVPGAATPAAKSDDTTASGAPHQTVATSARWVIGGSSLTGPGTRGSSSLAAARKPIGGEAAAALSGESAVAAD